MPFSMRYFFYKYFEKVFQALLHSYVLSKSTVSSLLGINVVDIHNLLKLGNKGAITATKWTYLPNFIGIRYVRDILGVLYIKKHLR